jgi:hypothetical protein
MKVAIICSDIAILDTLRLSFHFVLAQHLKPVDAHWYRDRAARGDFSIIDNGAAEGEPVSAKYLLERANMICADEIVLPDVLKDGHATIVASTEEWLLDSIPSRSRMVVPQGDSWGEWEWCLDSLLQRASPATIGVPKWIEGELPGGRLRALKHIRERGLDGRYNIHLLGLARPPLREIRELNFPFVRSIDTSLPIALAQQFCRLSGLERVSVDPTRPFSRRIAEQNVARLIRIVQETEYASNSILSDEEREALGDVHREAS